VGLMPLKKCETEMFPKTARYKFVLRFSFITACNFILFRIYSRHHFVYIMSPCVINKSAIVGGD